MKRFISSSTRVSRLPSPQLALQTQQAQSHYEAQVSLALFTDTLHSYERNGYDVSSI